MQVVLMAQGGNVDLNIISQATVRREIVLQLIQAMVDRGHREYADSDMDKVREHASAIQGTIGTPQVPAEVVATLNKALNLHDRRQGKAAAPPEPLAQEGEDPYETVQVSAVTLEGTDDVAMDGNTRTGTAFMGMADKLTPNVHDGVQSEDGVGGGQATLGILTGSARSQFEASFFMAAYPFLFPYSIGAPDLKYQTRDRRTESNMTQSNSA